MSFFLFVLLFLLILSLIISINNLFWGFPKAARILAWFVLMCADVILILEVASLFGVLNNAGYVLLIQFFVTGFSILINYKLRIGYLRVNLKSWFKEALINFRRISSFKLLLIFVLIIVINYVFLTFISIRYPQTISDTLYNHLSRIGYWIQQGSLGHYQGFSNYGMVYPYNNSLLMTLGVLFLRTSKFVGLIQLVSALMGTLAIYQIGRSLGFQAKSSLSAAMIFLTYPVIIYESITAQNDLLVASFICIAFAFEALFLDRKQVSFFVISSLALALAIGTNQYALLALPGYFALALFSLLKNGVFKRLSLRWLATLFSFSLILGSYSYVQNLIEYQSPFGPKGMFDKITGISNPQSIIPRVQVNSSRLFAQFISCDGLPPRASDVCIKLKEAILAPILDKRIESDEFLYTSQSFKLASPNVYNAESAWFGPVSWLIILVSAFWIVICAFRKKNYLGLFLVASCLTFFYLIILVKHGWDPYQGRYLITSVILIQPITAWIFEKKGFFGHLIKGIICALSVFIMVYATLNNVSMPLTSKRMADRAIVWGRDHNKPIQNLFIKLYPYFMVDVDIDDMDYYEIATIGNRSYLAPVRLVGDHVTSQQKIGILASPGLFPDFLFRGPDVRRSIFAFTDVSSVMLSQSLDYLLISPDFNLTEVTGFKKVKESEGWILFQQLN